MCIRDSHEGGGAPGAATRERDHAAGCLRHGPAGERDRLDAVSYTHLRAHETVLDIVCRLLLDKKKHPDIIPKSRTHTLNMMNKLRNTIGHKRVTKTQ